MNDIIDQAINEANEEAQAPVEPSNQSIPEASNEEAQAPKTEDQEPAEQEQQEGNDQEEGGDIAFPNKAVKAIRRRNKTITKLQAQYSDALRELNELKQAKEAPKEATKPSVDDFETLDDYLEAAIEFRTAQKSSADPQQPEQSKFTQEQIQQQDYYQERSATIFTRGSELASKIPDYVQLTSMNSDVIDSLPQAAVETILEMDDAPLALYALAKENRIEELSNMRPSKMAVELAKAEIRGQKYITVRPSAAPAPIKGARSVTHSAKTLENMSPDELLKKFL